MKYLKTVSNVLCCGRQKGVSEIYRSVKETGCLIKKVKLKVAVNEAFVKPTIGDGKIFILDLKECVRIRTGEIDGMAIG